MHLPQIPQLNPIKAALNTWWCPALSYSVLFSEFDISSEACYFPPSQYDLFSAVKETQKETACK